MPARSGSKAEQTAATTRKLVEVGRELFAARGFAHTGTEDLVRAAGVTRGALYHHFADKTALFHAVLDQVQREVGAAVEEVAARYDNPWDQLTSGCRAFLEACTRPDTQQIMLIDGPAVLGWSAWRQMDSQYSFQSLREGVSVLVRDGVIADQSVDALAHLLSGAMNEAALWVVQSATPAATLIEATESLGRLLAALRIQPG